MEDGAVERVTAGVVVGGCAARVISESMLSWIVADNGGECIPEVGVEAVGGVEAELNCETVMVEEEEVGAGGIMEGTGILTWRLGLWFVVAITGCDGS